MPDLSFTVVGAEPEYEGITPLMDFLVDVENGTNEYIQSIILHTQIRIEPLRRSYNAAEKERLVELFGEPERWGQSVRNLLWTHIDATVPAFRGQTRARLHVPVSFDLNVASAKYFYGLEDGEIPLVFLFSGTVFYKSASGGLLMQRISWENESQYKMPVDRWRRLMETYYPSASWLYIDRDVFDQLYAFKRRNRIPTWDATVSHLLERVEEKAV